MKKQVLMALGACYALCLPITAQITQVSADYRDTLIITTASDTKILFIGSGMENMKKYNRADSLKNYFMADLAKARQQAAYPSESKLTHYIVHPNGKRRLKSESDDYQEPALNLAKEIRAMDLNLPAYAYIIHDVREACEIQIYVASPEALAEVEAMNLTEAIRSIASAKRSQRKFTNIQIKQENGQWVRKAASHKKTNTFVLNSVLGIALLGGQLSPEIGVQFSYVTTDNHAVPVFKAGFLTTYCVLSDYSDKKFTNFYGVGSYNLTLMMRDGDAAADRWAGFELGRFDAEGGYLDGNYKLGIVYSIRSVHTGFHIYAPTLGRNKSDEVLYGFTVRLVL